MPANVVLQAVLLTAILIYTSVRDYKTREIPNAICLGVSLLAFLDFNPNNILGLTVGIFVWITVAFMCEEKFGGGDIKLWRYKANYGCWHCSWFLPYFIWIDTRSFYSNNILCFYNKE